jgi:hypothetical protein
MKCEDIISHGYQAFVTYVFMITHHGRLQSMFYFSLISGQRKYKLYKAHKGHFGVLIPFDRTLSMSNDNKLDYKSPLIEWSSL